MGCCCNRNTEEYKQRVRWLSEYHAVFDHLSNEKLLEHETDLLNIFKGQSVRLSHPMIKYFQMLTAVCADRDLLTPKNAQKFPKEFPLASCCCGPAIGILTPFVHKAGLICLHCQETLVPLEDFPQWLREVCESWGSNYEKWSSVVRWNQEQQARAEKMSGKPIGAIYEDSYFQCKDLLKKEAAEIVPGFLEHYPSVVWQDFDPAFNIRPEDIVSEETPVQLF